MADVCPMVKLETQGGARRWGGMAFAIFFFISPYPGSGAPGLSAAENATNAVAELKKLPFEELMDIEVTSVAKRPEKLFDTPSAIQVITQKEIRIELPSPPDASA